MILKEQHKLPFRSRQICRCTHASWPLFETQQGVSIWNWNMSWFFIVQEELQQSVRERPRLVRLNVVDRWILLNLHIDTHGYKLYTLPILRSLGNCTWLWNIWPSHIDSTWHYLLQFPISPRFRGWSHVKKDGKATVTVDPLDRCRPFVTSPTRSFRSCLAWSDEVCGIVEAAIRKRYMKSYCVSMNDVWMDYMYFISLCLYVGLCR